MPSRRGRPSPPPPTPAPDPHRLPTLPARRVRLRWLEESDVDALYAVFSDPDVMRYWSSPPFRHPDDAHIYLESIHSGFSNGNLMQWGIAWADTDQVIGTCTLAQIDTAQGRAEIGFALGHECWGQKLGREAVATVLQHAFRGLGLRRIEADVDPRNQASLKTLEALGFRREGYLRQRWLVAGERQDSVLLGLLDSEWSPPA